MDLTTMDWGKVLVQGGCRGGQKLPSCQTIPAGSKRDPPLAKAEPISDPGSACGNAFKKRLKKAI